MVLETLVDNLNKHDNCLRLEPNELSIFFFFYMVNKVHEKGGGECSTTPPYVKALTQTSDVRDFLKCSGLRHRDDWEYLISVYLIPYVKMLAFPKIVKDSQKDCMTQWHANFFFLFFALILP